MHTNSSVKTSSFKQSSNHNRDRSVLVRSGLRRISGTQTLNVLRTVVILLALPALACEMTPERRRMLERIKGCPVYEEEVAFPSRVTPEQMDQVDENRSDQFNQMYARIRKDFEDSGVQLEEISNGFKGLGIALQKVKDTCTQTQTRELLVTIDGDVSFAHGSAALTERAAELVSKVGAAMHDYPDTLARIGGHTDSTGSRAYNIGLSYRRADGVKNSLIERQKIEPERFIEIKGFADTQKIVETYGPEPKNRRVEIRIVMNDDPDGAEGEECEQEVVEPETTGDPNNTPGSDQTQPGENQPGNEQQPTDAGPNDPQALRYQSECYEDIL